MNDFYGQLERQLVEAGRRRAERGRWRPVPAGRARPLLAVATAVLVAVAAVTLAPALRPDSARSPAGGAAAPAPPAAQRDASLEGVSVAIFNATTTTGLGRAAADGLARRGASVRGIATDIDQGRARSVVEHGPGADEQARLVADALGVGDVRPLSQANPGRAGADAAVVVRLGADYRAP
ncbi:MAG: LytR C-terminal domain-containing protein [Solirubrobacteraceae bacterium]|nr:LytR C-terminal domain-containing protein [Solirubrobacteraceae bacterium]